jgi:hypothetical protein
MQRSPSPLLQFHVFSGASGVSNSAESSLKNQKDILQIAKKAIINIAKNYGYNMEDPETSAQLDAIMLVFQQNVILDKKEDDFKKNTPASIIIGVLDQFERRLSKQKINTTAETDTGLHPLVEIALTSMIVSSKYNEELSVWNDDYNIICATSYLNKLETNHLNALDWQAGIPNKQFEDRLKVIFKFIDPADIHLIKLEVENYNDKDLLLKFFSSPKLETQNDNDQESFSKSSSSPETQDKRRSCIIF